MLVASGRRPSRRGTLRVMKHALAVCVTLVVATALAGCGGTSASSPTSTAVTPTPAPSASITAAPATATPALSPSASPTPSVAALVIKEYDVAITLPAGLADATYRIDPNMAEGNEDVNGNAITELPGVRVWTASLAADSACSSVEQDGLVAISVFPSDPTGLDIPEGPGDFLHVGQYWFGISQEQAMICSDGNASEGPSVASLLQAYDTLHAT
jgi:hypothetical protein